MEFEIIPAEKAKSLRKAFIHEFIDTTTKHYKKHILTLIQYTDGLFYDGYLWDCLKENDHYQKECSMETAAEYLTGKKSVFAMWDLFSRERIRDGRRFSLEYPRDTVIRTDGKVLAQKVVQEWNDEQAAWDAGCNCPGLWLPKDIYCFDDSMDWYVIFTHEGWEKDWDNLTHPELDEDDYIRICFLSASQGT